MAEKYDEFLDELESDIRQEKWMLLWKKYGKVMTAVFTVAVGAAAAYTAWTTHTTNQRKQAADRFLHVQELISSGKTDQALLDLGGIVRDEKGDYGVFARLNKAALLGQSADATKRAEALQIYQEVRQDKKVDAAWRELADIFEIMLQADNPKPEEIQPLLDRLVPLIAEDSPWQHIALELNAVLLYRQGNNDAARLLFQKLAQDKDAPQGVILRAQFMTQLLSGGETL